MPNPPHEAEQGTIDLTEASSAVELGDDVSYQAWLDAAIVKNLTMCAGLTPVKNLQPRSRWAQENIAKGRVKGIVDSVLRILDHRRLQLSSDVRASIAACTDIDLARMWLDEAVSITDVSQLTGVIED